MGLILLIVLVLFLVGGLPNWGYHSFGFAPSGIAGVVLLVVVVLLLTGRSKGLVINTCKVKQI